METLTKTNEAPTIEAPTIAPACECGATLPPSGACLEVGECARADTAATRNASGPRAKFVPSAWNARGSVD